jgi:hypothetical protein
LFPLKNFSVSFRQLLLASPEAPTFGALSPASMQSCVSAVKTLFIDGR